MRIAIPFFMLPRHPLLRFLALLVGAVLVAVLIATGLVLGAALVVVGGIALLVRRWREGRRRQRAQADIIEGEFTVVSSARQQLPHND